MPSSPAVTEEDNTTVRSRPWGTLPLARRPGLPAAMEWAILLICVLAFIAGLRLLIRYIPFTSDWEVFFRPTTQGWLEGSLILYRDTRWFWNPPWLLWLLAPLAYWPVWLGWGILMVVTMFTIVRLTRKYRAWWLVFVSPLIVDPILAGQIDVVAMLGVALGWAAEDRPWLMGIALTLMATKPQVCFLVALWLWLHHRQRMQALKIPALVFLASLVIHGWDWPLRWANGSSTALLVSMIHNASPWHSIGSWMVPVVLLLGIWALRLPPTPRNLGALVAANALITPYLASYSLVMVLAFSFLPLGPVWAAAGWAASLTPLLRSWFGQGATRVDFIVAAVLMIGYLLNADRHVYSSQPPE